MGFWVIIGWLFIGAIIGWLASKIMHGKGGLVRNIIVGIAGSFLGGWLASWLGIGNGGVSTIGGFLIAVGGACILILISRLISGKR